MHCAIIKCADIQTAWSNSHTVNPPRLASGRQTQLLSQRSMR